MNTSSTYAGSGKIPSQTSGEILLRLSPIISLSLSPRSANPRIDEWQTGVGFVEGQISSLSNEKPNLSSIIEDEVIGL